MLPDRYRELLTAYVDGELTTRQRKAVSRLLHRSEEARQLLEQLQQDADILRGLPRLRLDRDLSSQVLLTIHQRRLHPGRHRLAQPVPAFPVWTGMAAAAAVLLVIGIGSYVYFAHSLPQDQLANVKPGVTTEKETKRTLPSLPPNAVAKVNTPAEPPKQEKPAKPRESTAPEVAVKTPDNTPEVAVSPMKVPEPPVVETSPTMELFKPSVANPPQLLLLGVHELDQEKPATQLREKLQKDAAYRVELPCKDGNKAFERLQVVLKAEGIGLVIEQGAQARLKTPRLKTNYVLYVEDLTPNEVTRLLQQLGGEDKKAEAKRRGDGQFDMVVVNQLTKDDHKELSELLGVNPTQFQPTRPAAPLGVDPRKPLSENTADQVTAILAGQGGAPRPDPSKPAVKPPEHQALVMAYNPVRPRPGSAEVKRFLDSRKQPRAGAVQVLLVLRGTNG